MIEADKKILVSMNVYRLWRLRRDELIKAGLVAGLPIWQIATQMGINRSVVYRVKKKEETTVDG
jgi:Homeodomain-like domain